MAKKRDRMILKGHRRQVSTVVEDERGLASIDWAGDLCLWSMWSPRPARRIAAHTDRGQGVLLGPDWVATSGFDRAVRLWDRRTLALLAETTEPDHPRNFVRYWDLRRSADGAWLEALFQHGGHFLHRFPIGADGRPDLHRKVVAGDWEQRLPDDSGPMVREPGEDGYVLRALRDDGTERWRMTMGPDYRGEALSADLLWLALSTSRSDPRRHGRNIEELFVKTVPDGAIVQRISFSAGEDVHPWGFSPDRRLLLGVGGGRRLLAWEVASGRPVFPEGWRHTDTVSRVMLSRDGTTLISSGWDGTVRLWDLTEILRGLAPAPEGALPQAPAPVPAPTPAPPVGMTDPTALLLAGHSAAALAAYSDAALDARAPDPKTARAWRHLDEAVCLLQLGDLVGFRERHRAAEALLNRSGDLLNERAWALLMAGEAAVAAVFIEACFASPVVDMGQRYPYAIDTWLRVQVALGGGDAALVVLACHARELARSDAADLIGAQEAAIEAFWARPHTDAERDVIAAHFARIDTHWSARAGLASALLAHDLARWGPHILAVLAEARVYWTSNELISVLAAADPGAGVAAVRARLVRWLNEAIRAGAKLALRELVLRFFDTGQCGADLHRKLAAAAPANPSFSEAFVYGLVLAAPHQQRIRWLGFALCPDSVVGDTQRTIERSDGVGWVEALGPLLASPRGVVVVVDGLGRANSRRRSAREALGALLAVDPQGTLDAIVQAGPKAQPRLLAFAAAHPVPGPLLGETLARLALSRSGPVRRATLAALKERADALGGVAALLSSGREDVRQLAAEALAHHGRG